MVRPGPEFQPEEATVERTLSIIKPDAVKGNHIGAIVARFEEEGLRIAAMRKVHLSKREAEGFYAVHSERPFFGELTDFISSGPAVVMVLEGDNAILRNREIMGATNPAEAAEGTLRQLYAASIGENAVHGSDAPETAATEIAYFFRSTELN
jgi:nucleoside-diphosphate kinase